jgi:hypothetical protein
MKKLLGLLTLLAALSPMPVFAASASDQALINKAYEAQHFCRIPEDAPSMEASDKACAERETLWRQVEARGYCFDQHEQEFVTCNLPKLQIRQ